MLLGWLRRMVTTSLCGLICTVAHWVNANLLESQTARIFDVLHDLSTRWRLHIGRYVDLRNFKLLGNSRSPFYFVCRASLCKGSFDLLLILWFACLIVVWRLL